MRETRFQRLLDAAIETVRQHKYPVILRYQIYADPVVASRLVTALQKRGHLGPRELNLDSDPVSREPTYRIKQP